jgi:hypothetical protein
MRRTYWVPGLALLALTSLLAPARAQEAKRPGDDEREAHLARMKAVASTIELRADPQRPDSAVKLLDEPILRYTDNTRENRESSLWLWSSGGRPDAMLAVEFYPAPPKGPRWLYEIASLSPARIAARHESDLQWTAKKPGLTLTALPDAQTPAATAARRLSQMKAIFRSFTAHESAVIEGRIELRQLSSPLHRYDDQSIGVVDGAIFAFANGTNPEVILLLEALADKESKLYWQYSLAQMTGGEVSVELDGKEVWHQGEADPPAVRDSYVNGWLPAKESEE